MRRSGQIKMVVKNGKWVVSFKRATSTGLRGEAHSIIDKGDEVTLKAEIEKELNRLRGYSDY